MFWRTAEGDPYSKLEDVYGHLVSSAGEEFRALCESRYILSLFGKDARHAMVSKIVAMRVKRGSFDDPEAWAGASAKLRFDIEAGVMREWRAQKQQRDAAAGATGQADLLTGAVA